jgi:hypothetical protein
VLAWWSAVVFGATGGPIDSETKRTRLLSQSYTGECSILRKGRESYTEGYDALAFAPTEAAPSGGMPSRQFLAG